MVYSATSLAKYDDLSSSNVVGESYSIISPTPDTQEKSEEENNKEQNISKF